MRDLSTALLALLSIPAATALAEAPPPPDAAFEAWALEVARLHGQTVSDWWLANLDEDPALERVAVLYDKSGETGDFLLWKDADHRWDLVFAADGLTSPGFDPGPPATTKLEDRHKRYPKGYPANGVDYRQGHRGGYDDKSIGLRHGQPVVIREGSLEDARAGDHAKRIDWDQRVKAKKGSYPTLGTGDAPGYGELKDPLRAQVSYRAGRRPAYPAAMRLALLAGLVLASPLVHADGMGQLDFPTSCTPPAQARFLEGMLALHSFMYDDAGDAFKMAQTEDAKCAMALWGEAMAVNHSLWGQQDTGEGRQALAKAAALAAKLPEKERAWLDAAGVLYGADDQVDKATRETAYAEAMKRMHERWPDDDEVTAFYALSLMQASHPADKSIRLRMQAGALALGLFAKHPGHPGAAHYVIHAFDDPDHAIIALPAARAYAQIAPDAAHARHMPAHIFVQLGMWAEAITSCESAWQASVEAAQRKNRKGWADWHSKSWLVALYLQEGRPTRAREALEAFIAGARGDAPGVAPLLADAALTFADETGRWDDLDAQLAATAPALEKLAAKKKEEEAKGMHQHLETGRPPPALQVKMTIAYGHAFAAARKGDDKAVGRALAEYRAAVAQAPAVPGEVPLRELAKVDELLVGGLLALAQKKYPLATTKLEQAIELHEKLSGQEYFASPDRVPIEEYLGEAYLAAGKPREAGVAYRRALAKVPGRSRSILGAARAASRLGDAAAASELYGRLATSWAHAEDGWPGLDEVRAHTAAR